MNYVRVGGYIPPQPIEDYNDLPNIPVHNQDLTASGFTPVTNTYYKHTGTTTASYTNGVIYYYNGTGYVALDGSAYGLATVAKTGSYNDLLDKPTIPTDYVPNTRKVNNKALSSDITLGASDVGALPTSGGTVTGNLTVGGNLTINGTTTTVDSTTLQVKDKLIEVAHGNTATLTTPAGLVAPKYDGTNSGALVFDSTGTAYVGDVTFKDGNIDVANSGLQPLATRTGLVGGNLVQYDSSALTLKDSGKKISDLALKTDISSLMPKKGGTFTGEVKFGSTENFQGYYIKRMIGSLGAGTAYNNLDSKYKDGTYHRMWRLRFPNGSSFWGKIKITLYGGYSSFNASGVMSKSVTCNFNTSNIYNNVGCYDGLGVNVEQDFRISEAIWNATVSAWEVLIWQKNLNGNNSPTIMLECWTANNTNYINAFNGITAQTVELTQSTSYSAQKASSTGGTKTVEWATLPVYENPLGEEIATVAMLEDKQDKITSSNKLSSSLVDGLGAAAAKAVDTAITANSTSTNLPTSKAVEDRINAHSGIDKVGTVTGVKMNGTTKNPSSGVVDLGTVITAHQDISGKANLAGGNTFSGVQTINAPTNVSGSEQTTMKVKTSNGGAIIFGKEGANSGTMIRLDQADGTCRLRFRSSKTAGAMVWEQPEHGAKLHVDLGKDGSDKHRITFPSSGGTLALTSQIPKVNNGTLTIQKNGTKVQTFTANQSGNVTANITVPTKASDVNALSLDGGTINKSKTIQMDASANSDGANLKWGTVNSKNPYIGYASDQVDGTFVVGSLLGTNYASGLAIGGGSGNLLWKGTKVATTSDIPKLQWVVPTSVSEILNAIMWQVTGEFTNTPQYYVAGSGVGDEAAISITDSSEQYMAAGSLFIAPNGLLSLEGVMQNNSIIRESKSIDLSKWKILKYA